MGETAIKIAWVRAVVEEVLKELEKDFDVEAAMIFGSWCRSGGGAWSDIDVLVVSDGVAEMSALERFAFAARFRDRRVDLFLYTFEEIERMALRGNPLALSALIEGIPIRMSARVQKLAEHVKKCFVRRGRVWIRIC